MLRDLLGVSVERTRFLENQANPYAKLSRGELVQQLGTDRVLEVPYGGEDVTRASLNGFPVVMSRSGNPLSKAIQGLADDLDRSGKELLALAR